MKRKVVGEMSVPENREIFARDPGQRQAGGLTARDKREMDRLLSAARERLEAQEGLMFDGDPASPKAVESILAAMELGLQAAKQRNKEKYTPKKYRQG